MTVRLDIPCHSQLNNKYNPTGSCNVTSVAMCLNYWGIQSSSDYQLEDELYVEMVRRGLSRHDPWDLKEIAETYEGITDDFTPNGTFDNLFAALDSGYPCILHGYFTRFGHIIVVTGYDDKGFWVHDPYGEWHSWGYDTNVSGCDLHYSYDLIGRTCSPETVDNPRNIWLHVVKGPKKNKRSRKRK